MRRIRTLGSLLALIVGSLLATGVTTVAHMGRPGPPGSGMGEPLAMDEAVNIAQRHMDRLGLHDVALTEIMEFENHFHAAMTETDTGRHAFALTIDRYNGQVRPAPGPNGRWNLKYGPMMTGAAGPVDDAAVAQPMAVSPDQARDRAQRFLHQHWPGASVDPEEVWSSYGYHTMPFHRQGQIAGMLSVHGTTGEVWHHDWHGAFLGMRHLGGQHHMGHWMAESPHDVGRFPFARFESNGNGMIDDPEFMAMMDAWMQGDLNNDQFLRGMDLWISGRSVRSAAVPDTSSNNALAVTATTRGQALTFRAQSVDVTSMRVTIYGLDGRPIFSGETSGAQLAWPMVTDEGQTVANGTYLYRVMARTSDGQLQQSDIQRIVFTR